MDVPVQQSAILRVNVAETVLEGCPLTDPVIIIGYAAILVESIV
jgi:hypothetical protein